MLETELADRVQGAEVDEKQIFCVKWLYLAFFARIEKCEYNIREEKSDADYRRKQWLLSAFTKHSIQITTIYT